MNQATRKRTAPFLTTVRTLNNDERYWAWQRRKREHDDQKADDRQYLWVWLLVFLFGLAITVGQFFLPCLVVWTSAGVHCL